MRNTWFIDIDGTIVEHKSNKELDERLMFLGERQVVFPYGDDIEDIELLDEKILPGVRDFWLKIPKKDVIILTTAREHRHKWLTEQMLRLYDLRYDEIIFALGSSKRFLLNDREPHKTPMDFKDKAIAVNVERNEGLTNANWAFAHI